MQTSSAAISTSASIDHANFGLRLFSKILVVAVLCLIFIGSLVTSHDAGLSVPDWPTTYGQNMYLFPYSKWLGGIFYEHSHRLFASLVGVLTVILTVWVTWSEPRFWLKALSWCALAAVILQGLLGGLTVLLGLPTWTSACHAVLAQTFLLITTIIAYVYSGEFSKKSRNARSDIFNSCLLLIGIIYLQLIVGAIMRHSGAGLAIPDFPRMGDSWSLNFSDSKLAIINEMRRGMGLAPVDISQILIHLTHRLLGALLTCTALYISIKTLNLSDDKLLRSSAKMIAALVVVQFSLGALSVVTAREPLIASLHVLIGAVFLMCSVIFALRSSKL